MMRRVVYVLLMIGFLFLKGEAMGNTLSESIDVVKAGAVQLAVAVSGLDDELKKKVGRDWINQPAGSGFLVSHDGHIITALHVIDSMNDFLNSINAKKKNMYVNIPIPPSEDVVRNNLSWGNFILLEFDVIDRDVDHDIALLKPRTNPFTKEFRERSKQAIVVNGKSEAFDGHPISLNLHRPRDGSSIAVSGYPLGEPSLVTNSGFIATSWASYRNQSKPGTKEFNAYLGDVQVNPGNSGGPAYLVDDGSVIGVCIAHKLAPINIKPLGIDIGTNAGLTIVVPAKYVAEILTQVHGLNNNNA